MDIFAHIQIVLDELQKLPPGTLKPRLADGVKGIVDSAAAMDRELDSLRRRLQFRPVSDRASWSPRPRSFDRTVMTEQPDARLNLDHTMRQSEKLPVKTETISEVVFTSAQLLELVRAYYGAEVVPPDAEVKPYYPVAEFGGVRFRWKWENNGAT